MKITKLTPALVPYIWGGSKLRDEFNKPSYDGIGEAWELSYDKTYPSTALSGSGKQTPVEELFTKSDVGANSDNMPFFPLLIKLIDAKLDLSIQVHPNDEYALKNENQYGKTELWYVLSAEKGAHLYFGLKEEVSREELPALMESGEICDKLNCFEAKAGDVFFVKSGTIHAIGAGITVYEVQQNSTLTYRLYDFKRVDKNGKFRELHTEKAAKVCDLVPVDPSSSEYEAKTIFSDGQNTLKAKILGACKYFFSAEYEFSGRITLPSSKNTFMCLTCVEGAGEITGEQFAKGDSFFVPAGFEKIEVEGKGKFVMSKVAKYYLGIDLGGTMIKGGLVTDEGEVVFSTQIATETEKGATVAINNIIKLCKLLTDKTGIKEINGVGIGIPGMIDSAGGEVVYANNLHWDNVQVIKPVSDALGVPVKITNDANAAALGEAKFGAGAGFNDSVFITLGTGVGGGIVLNGKLFEGKKSAGAEIGHTVISSGGEECTCGRRGCFEAYASATALIRDTKREMEKNKSSKMWQKVNGDISRVDGRTAFDLKNEDESAKKVVDNYIKYLAEGIVNVCNVFRPDAILLGGGVANQGDALTVPLQKLVDKYIYGGEKGPRVPVLKATLKNDAGFLGAAALVIE